MKSLTYSLALMALLSLVGGTSSAQCPNTRPAKSARVAHQVPNKPRPCHQVAPRPSRTSEGVPIRWVDVPIPAYATGNYYRYGYGGYGYGNYGSSAYDYSDRLPNQQSRPRRAARRKTTIEPLPVDPRTARNYKLRKALNTFARENSVGGRIYLNEGRQKWLLKFDGSPKFQNNSLSIPCLGKRKGQSDQKLTLVARYDGQKFIEATVLPRS